MLSNDRKDLSQSLVSKDTCGSPTLVNRGSIRDTLADFLVSPASSRKRKRPPSNKRKRKLDSDILLDVMAPVSTPSKSRHISSILSTGKKNNGKNGHKQVRFADNVIPPSCNVLCDENRCAKKQKFEAQNEMVESHAESLPNEDEQSVSVNQTDKELCVGQTTKNLESNRCSSVISPHNQRTLDIVSSQNVSKTNMDSKTINARKKMTDPSEPIGNSTAKNVDIPDKAGKSASELFVRSSLCNPKKIKHSDSTSGDELFSQVSPALLDQMCDEAFVTYEPGKPTNLPDESNITEVCETVCETNITKICETDVTEIRETDITELHAKPDPFKIQATCDVTKVDSPPCNITNQGSQKKVSHLHIPMDSEHPMKHTPNCNKNNTSTSVVGSSCKRKKSKKFTYPTTGQIKSFCPQTVYSFDGTPSEGLSASKTSHVDIGQQKDCPGIGENFSLEKTRPDCRMKTQEKNTGTSNDNGNYCISVV